MLGVKRVLREDPHHRPGAVDRSTAPHVHCVDEEERKAFIKAYRDFVADYQTAMDALHQGVEEACFPEAGIRPGCYWQGGAG